MWRVGSREATLWTESEALGLHQMLYRAQSGRELNMQRTEVTDSTAGGDLMTPW